MKKIIFLGILIGLLFTQNVRIINAKIITGDVEEVLNRVVDFILHDLPGIVPENFKEKVLPIWKEMYEWFKKNVWEEIKPFTEEEIARRKQIAEALDNITEDGVKYQLDNLKKSGRIIRIGADKGGYWEVQS